MTLPKEQQGFEEVIVRVEFVYNRLVLFDGNFFPHGSAVNNKQYFMELDSSPRNFRSNINFFYHPYGKEKKDK